MVELYLHNAIRPNWMRTLPFSFCVLSYTFLVLLSSPETAERLTETYLSVLWMGG
jgi:hypothetical protein